MKNGKQLALENVKLFSAWKAERFAADDWSDYIRGNILNRAEIARECGFAKSALRQNPAIKASLEALESDLREKGILDQKDESTSQSASEGALRSRAAKLNGQAEMRVKALEEKNAVLIAEVQDLRAQLKQYQMRDQHLAETGRMLKL